MSASVRGVKQKRYASRSSGAYDWTILDSVVRRGLPLVGAEEP